MNTVYIVIELNSEDIITSRHKTQEEADTYADSLEGKAVVHELSAGEGPDVVRVRATLNDGRELLFFAPDTSASSTLDRYEYNGKIGWSEGDIPPFKGYSKTYFGEEILLESEPWKWVGAHFFFQGRRYIATAYDEQTGRLFTEQGIEFDTESWETCEGIRVDSKHKATHEAVLKALRSATGLRWEIEYLWECWSKGKISHWGEDGGEVDLPALCGQRYFHSFSPGTQLNDLIKHFLSKDVEEKKNV